MITHKGTKKIVTERLILRQFTPDDANAMFENWANDQKVTKFLTWQPHSSPEETRGLLEQWCKAYESCATYNWAIEFEGQIIGNISVVRSSDTNEYAELGYCMGTAYWGKGIMTEAAKAVIDYLFRQVGMHRVGIAHATENPASGRVAQKCGLRYEGTKRHYYKTKEGKFLDIAWYAILNPYQK